MTTTTDTPLFETVSAGRMPAARKAARTPTTWR